MLVVGIDPDSNKHGLAIVQDGKIVTLESLNTDELVSRLTIEASLNKLCIKLEDVLRNKAVYPRPGLSKQSMLRIAQNVGACKQNAQYLAQRLEQAGFKLNMVNPLPKALSGKSLSHKSFCMATGWQPAKGKRNTTNADQRDAAMIALHGRPQLGTSWVYCGVMS
jgi:Holliday junction resolvasome RuvABC endonuclease subunit